MLNITQAVTQAVRGTFNYTGRARRSEYWWTWLFIIVLVVASGYLDEILFPEVSEADLLNFYGGGWKEWLLDWKYLPISTTLYYLTLPTFIAVTARRMHDVGRPAWIGILPTLAWELNMVLPFEKLMNIGDDGDLNISAMLWITLLVAIVGVFLAVYSFFLSIRDSDRYSNQYGPSPKYHDEAAEFD